MPPNELVIPAEIGPRFYPVNGIIKLSEGRWCGRDATQHEMNARGESQRMFLDQTAFLLPPGNSGGRRNTAGKTRKR